MTLEKKGLFSAQPSPIQTPQEEDRLAPHTAPHIALGHSHRLLSLLFGLSRLLLSNFLSRLGLSLNLTEALAAHLLGTQPLLGTQLEESLR